eukprot:g16210.t1
MYAASNPIPLAARPKLTNFTKYLSNSGGYLYCIVKYGQQDHVFIRHEEEKDIFYLGPDIWPNNDIYYIIENYPELAATNNVAGGRIALKVRDVGFELEGVKKASADEINKLKEKTNDYKVLYDLASMEVENERQKNVEAVNTIALERKAQELAMDHLYKKSEEELRLFQQKLQSECLDKLNSQLLKIQGHEQAVKSLQEKTSKMKETEDAVQEKLRLIMEQLIAMNKLMLHVCQNEKVKEEETHTNFSNPFHHVLEEKEILKLNLFDDIVCLIEDIVREHRNGDPSPKSRTAKTRKYHPRTVNIYSHILPNGNYQLLTIGQRLKINPWPLISRTISVITTEILTKRVKITKENKEEIVEERQWHQRIEIVSPVVPAKILTQAYHQVFPMLPQSLYPASIS